MVKGRSSTVYNYLVEHEGKKYYFKMTSEINEKFGIPINTIFFIINKKNKKKWTDFKITKIKKPVFQQLLISYDEEKSETSAHPPSSLPSEQFLFG